MFNMINSAIDFKKIPRQSLSQRVNKYQLGQQFPSDFEKAIVAIRQARKHRKPIILMMGAHLIKLGLSKIIIDMIRQGYITHLAMNGAASIHDFEIAYQGATSEDVEKNIRDGTFGNWEETGKMMNEAINRPEYPDWGMGKIIGKLCSKQKYSRESILAWSCAMELPTTVHVAIGTDFIHQHPLCDGAKTGQATYNDFKLFANSVTKLQKGAVIICLGSAVILPEVFLKSISISRALGFKTKDFTSIVIDKNIQYREMNNVIKRMTKHGYYIQGQFEDYLPMLWDRLKPR